MLPLALRKPFQISILTTENNKHYRHVSIWKDVVNFLANFVNIFTFNPGALFKDEIIADNIAGNYYWLTDSIGKLMGRPEE